MIKQVKIFTDGSCLNNPGAGGYGAILQYKKEERVFSVGYYLTTNNRMELMAVIAALETLKDTCEVTLTTDSKYVMQGITQWINRWKTNCWRTVGNKTLKNIDLWKRLDIAVRPHNILWRWIKSHNGHIENERCDILARTAAGLPTAEDIGYIND